METTHLLDELNIIRIELRQLGRLIPYKNSDASNHQLALLQHVTRIIKELENDSQRDI